MQVIENISSEKFSFNSVEYFKIFMPLKTTASSLRIVNVYDSRLVLMEASQINEIQVNGFIHNNLSDLINAVSSAVFKPSSGGGGFENAGDFSGVVNLGTGKTLKYSDYLTGPVVNLTAGNKTPGSYATVRIKGSLTGTFPSSWAVSGTAKSTSSSQFNEISIGYFSDNDIRAVIRVYAIPGEAPAPDSEAPTAPSSLSSPSKTSTSVNLSWAASSDNVGVTGYVIYKGGVYEKEVSGTTATITGLSASTAYSFQVSAIDAQGNESLKSTALQVTTEAAAPSFEYVEFTLNSGITLEGEGTVRRTLTTQSGTYTIGARGTKAMNGNNTVLFSAAPNTDYAGLGITNAYPYSGSNFGINMDIVVILDDDTVDKKIFVFEDGVQTFTANNGWALGDIFELQLTGTTVAVKRNGTTIFTSAQVISAPLTPVVIFNSPGGNPKIINARFADPSNLIATTI